MKPFIPHEFSRRWLGVGMTLMAAAAYAGTTVTFQVDMTTVSSPTPPSYVSVSGSFNGWPSPPPGQTVSGTSDPVTNSLLVVQGTSKIWTNSFVITDPPGTVEQYKFQSDLSGWEGIANRTFTLGADGTTQVLPVVYWNDTPPNAPTNQVTFQVDMTPQVVTKTFVNGTGILNVSGNFTGWGDGLPLTNNPAASGLASNIYSGTYPVVGYTPTTAQYKYRANGGWEDGSDHFATITNSTQVLPLAYYNNASLSDLMAEPTLVTFSLYITNGTPDKDGSPYVKGIDRLYINGNFFAHDSSGTVVPAGTGGYWTWNVLAYPANTGPASAELIESAIPDVYTNSFLLPAGSGYKIEYKYSQDGFDDENGFQTNHVRYVRTYPPAYVFPQDVWSFLVTPPYPNPLVVEPSFGNLAIGSAVGGNLPITWLGRPAVVLQHSSTLSGGIWISEDATSGTQFTNWPNAGGNQFFRLFKKP